MPPPSVAAMSPIGSLAGPGVQLAFDQLDRTLKETTFVVVDLETTGARAAEDAITEIGAVRVCGGEVLGEFATLVDPGRPIPRAISRLTGITDQMVAGSPQISAVLPMFLEFAGDAVLVAHNAPFDIGFLRAAAARLGHRLPPERPLCTVKLARRVLPREEAPSVKLSELARILRTTTRPTHRALDDARTTVEVLHTLLGRLGSHGVTTLAELRSWLPGVTAAQRDKRHLADALPPKPGVYLFRGPKDEALYIGTAVDLRRRVRGYFTGSETRTRMREMVALTTRIDHVECAHGLEAQIRELQLIAAHAPPYNRRSKNPHRGWWIRLSDEPFPRLIVGRKPVPGALGPFSSRAVAAETAEAVAAGCRIRTCTARLRVADRHGPDCGPLGRVGGCPAAPPGSDPVSAAQYADRLPAVTALFDGRDDAALARLADEIESLAGRELFETAARRRDRLVTAITALERVQRARALTAVDELVAARPDGAGGWYVAVIRAGRLAGAGHVPPRAPVMATIDAIVAGASTVPDAPEPLRGAPAEQVRLITDWLHTGGTRLVRTSTGYATPSRGAGRWAEWVARARQGRADPADDGRLG